MVFTLDILGKVLDGNTEASRLLAGAVHESISTETDPTLQGNNTEVSIDEIGIWIDPIGKATTKCTFINMGQLPE